MTIERIREIADKELFHLYGDDMNEFPDLRAGIMHAIRVALEEVEGE